MSAAPVLPPRPSTQTSARAGLRGDHFQMGDGYHVFRRRGTPTALLFHTIGGRGFFRSGRGGVHVTSADELAFYEPNVEHEYGTVPGEGARWNFHWVHFYPRAHWSQWLSWPTSRMIPGLRLVRVPANRRTSLVSLWQRLHGELNADGPWQRELALNTLERILLVVGESLGRQAHRPLDARVRRTLAILDAHPRVRHRVPALARQVGLSPSRLSHLFREQTGLSIVETALRARLREVEKALELTQEPISEIAYELGFSSPQHLTTQFVRRYGVSPRLYRARVQQDSPEWKGR